MSVAKGSSFISIHAAREGGDKRGMGNDEHIIISIHAAREGGDKYGEKALDASCNFNPRRP